VSLAQPVRFLLVKLTHLDSNSRFEMIVVFTANYSFSGRQRPRRQRDTLGDRFRESQDQAGSVFRAQSSGGAHRSRIYVRVFIGVGDHTYMCLSARLYCVSKKI
jgi:hypothetical protein